MDFAIKGSGIPAERLQRYVDEQIFTMPGADAPRDSFSVVLTGSRATGTHAAESDIDIEVLCPRDVYDRVQHAAFEKGLTSAPWKNLYMLVADDWMEYFGPGVARPHYTLNSLEEVERQFAAYDDVWLWVWTNAKVIHDPHGQFSRICDSFAAYPQEILIRKLTYRWMLALYWSIEQSPHHRSGEDELLPSAAAVLNGVNDYLRFFFLVDGRPFPYAKRLAKFAPGTSLGAKFMPFFNRVVDLVVGRAWTEHDAWVRLDEAKRLISDGDTSPDIAHLEMAGLQAMRDAGVDPQWLENHFNNMDQLLTGALGPVP